MIYFKVWDNNTGHYGFRLRAGWRYVCLKAPWGLPSFSERNGYVITIPLGFGWRVIIRK